MGGLQWQDWRNWKVEGEFPQMNYKNVVAQLIRQYQGAKFILNMRDVKGWIRAVHNHGDLRARMTNADLPGLPSGVGEKDEQLAKKDDSHREDINRLMQQLSGIGMPPIQTTIPVQQQASFSPVPPTQSLSAPVPPAHRRGALRELSPLHRSDRLRLRALRAHR